MHGQGEITRIYKTLKPKKEMCRGCRNDFYNAGNNGLGVEECWSFKNAQVVDKLGYRSIHSVEKDERKVQTLSCWHAVSK